MSDHFITIVSGLPRSGTSLMMQMLAAGGMELLTDGRRVPDEHNPRGYFEHEGVKHSRNDLSWLDHAAGKAVKVIHLLLLHLPAARDYRVVFLDRDIQEVIASQRAMLKQQGRTGAALSDSKLAEIFESQLTQVRQWLAERANFQTLYVNHSSLIRNPLTAAEQINAFLGGHLWTAKMADAVNPALYRQRKSAR
jgi:Sulfotransferase domain